MSTQAPHTALSPDKNLPHSTVRLHGVPYQVFENQLTPSETLDAISSTEFRDNDVICLGFPRSGNHWAYDVVQMVMRQTTEFIKSHFWYDLLEVQVSSSKDFLESRPSPRYIATHVRPQRLPDQVVKKNVKMIYLLRNPKDVMVSWHHLLTTMKESDGGFQWKWDQFFDAYMNGDLPYGTWFDHVTKAEEFMEANPEVPVYIHVYEEMKQDPVKCVRDLCHYLDVPDTLAEEIAKVTAFDNMKKNAKKFDEIGKDLFIKSTEQDSVNSSPLMRKGVIGDWKGKFTAAQDKMFDQAFREKMSRSRLAPLIAEYI